MPSPADDRLIRNLAFIDGAWVGADDGATFEVTDPATGEVLAVAPDMGAAETRRALAGLSLDEVADLGRWTLAALDEALGTTGQQLLLDALAKAVTGKEELEAVLHWRGKHTQAIRERAPLQQRLTAAEERVDLLETALRKIKARLDAYAESDMRMPEPSVEVCQSIADAALKPAEGSGKTCACPGCDSPRRENSPFCVAHRSVKSRTRGQDPLTADGLEWLMQNDGLQQ